MREIYVGRAPNCEIRLASNKRYASGRHAVIYQDGGQIWLRDVSTNGTMVNGTMIHRRAIPIKYGDSIKIAGKYPLSWDKISMYISAPSPQFYQTSPDVQMGNSLLPASAPTPAPYAGPYNPGRGNSDEPNYLAWVLVCFVGVVLFGGLIWFLTSNKSGGGSQVADAQPVNTSAPAPADTSVVATTGEDILVSDVVGKAFTESLQQNNNTVGSSSDASALLTYCDANINNIQRLLSIEQKLYYSNQDTFADYYGYDAEAFFAGDGNHDIFYYFINGGDPNFAQWDEEAVVSKWEISSVSVEGDKAKVSVKVYLVSTYEGNPKHWFTSRLKLKKVDGEWRFYDFNGYLSGQGNYIKQLARFPNQTSTRREDLPSLGFAALIASAEREPLP